MAEVAEAIRSAKDIYDLRPFMQEDGYSSCPCFHIRTPEFAADAHCWRIGCDYHANRKTDGRCCLHVDTRDQALAEKVRDLLDEADWYGGWALEVGPLEGET